MGTQKKGRATGNRQGGRTKRAANVKRKSNRTLPQPSATPKDVAAWMISQIEEHGELLQVAAVAAIEKEFGVDFIYLSEIGELSIDKRVLYHFRKLTEKSVVWVTRPGGGFWDGAHWRPRDPHDHPGRTQHAYYYWASGHMH